VAMNGINWPAVRFKRRRPSWRKRPRGAGMVSIRLFVLDGQHLEKAGKDLKDDTVRAPRQAELRELTDASVLRLAQQGDAVAFERIYRLHSRKVAAWIFVPFRRPFR
jgi:hypothetical protein